MKKYVVKSLVILFLFFFIFIIFSILNIAEANEVIAEWDISENDGKSKVTATLYSDGRFVLSGNGSSKNYAKSEDREYVEYREQIKSVVIEDGIESIGKGNFSRFDHLEKVQIGNTLHKIGDGAFYQCYDISKIYIPDSVSVIENTAFGYCNNLKRIRISNNVKNIPENLFYKCSRLTEIILPNNLQRIEKQAFYECSCINTLVLPESLNYIGERAFQGCKELKEIDFKNNVSLIGKYAFKKCKYLTKINLNENVEISDNAFEECSNIEQIVIPESVKFHDNVFYNAKLKLSVEYGGEKNVEIPNFIDLNNNYETRNCIVNSDGSIKVNTLLYGTKYIKINEGKYKGLEILIKVKSNKGNVPEFYGTTNITLKVGDTLDLKNSYFRIHAKDYEDGNITGNINIISNNVNTSKAGNYQVGYEIIDSDGNKIYTYVPVQIIEEGERKVQRTLYTLQDTSYLNNSGYARANSQDFQSLGIFLPANAMVNVKYIEYENNESIRVYFYNNDRLTESGNASVVNNISTEIKNDLGEAEYYVYSNTNYAELVSGESIDLKNNVKIKYKKNGENQENIWEKYSGKSFDSVPVVKTPVDIEINPVLEINLNDDIKSLDYYTFGDDMNKFKNDWKQSQNSFAILDGSRCMFLVPFKDCEKLGISKKSDTNTKYRHDNFNNINDILTYHDNIVETYDRWIGLSDDENAEKYNKNIKSKFFIKADKHGPGGAAYGLDSSIFMTSDSLDVFLHREGDGWTALHEIGHGYQGNIITKDLYLLEISNNFLAYYYQKNYIENEDWLQDTVGDINKQEQLMNAVKNKQLEDNYNSYLEYYPKRINEEVAYTGANQFKLRLFAYVNLFNKIGMEDALKYTYSYYRKMKYYKDENSISATDIIAKGFSEGTGYNVIPYLESWGLTISNQVKKEIYDKNYPIVYYLNELAGENAENISIENNLPYKYSLVTYDDIKKSNLKGNLRLKINENLPNLYNKTITLKSGDNIIRTINVNNSVIDLTNIPIGAYELELEDNCRSIEPQYITISENVQNSVDISSVNLQKIEIEEYPTKKSYLKGEQLDLSDIKVKAIFDNDTFEYISNYNVSGYDPNILGNQEITITYGEKAASFYVTVHNNFQNIEITSTPSKTTYVQGQSLDLSGLEVMAVYEDGSRQKVEVTSNMVTGYYADELGEQELTVIYKRKKATFNVTVIKKELQEINITTPPTKTSYIEGEIFERAGMVVKATYNDGTERTIENYSTNGEGENGVSIQGNSYPYNSSVTITYTEDGISKIATQKIYVAQKQIEEIIVDKDNMKTIYKKGSELDLEGGKLVVKYDNKKEETIDLTSDEINITGYNKNQIGEQEITVTYKGKETRFNVTVTGGDVYSVILNGSTTVEVGKSIKLVATVQPEDADNKNVIWESSDSNIATVDSEGNVTGISNGTATITVTTEDGGKQASKTITVKTAVEGIELNSSEISLIKGHTEELLATVKPETASNKKVTVTSSDENIAIAELDETNNKITVTAVETGTATIIVKTKDGNKKAQCIVTVHNNLENIEITSIPSKTTYVQGQNLDLSGLEVMAVYEDGSRPKVEVTSDMVSGYNANQTGEQEITVTYQGKTASFKVTVHNNLENIEITSNPSKTEYVKGENLDLDGLEVIATYEDGSKQTLEVTSDMVTGYNANKLGEQEITVTYQGKTASFKVTVHNNLENIEITSNPSKIAYVKGEELNLAGLEVIATYEDESKAKVEITPNMVTGYNANKLGEQEITVTYQGKTASFKVSVEEKNETEKYEIIEKENNSYLRISTATSKEEIVSKMNEESLLDEMAHFEDLTEDGKLRTGSKIVSNNEVKYIVVIKGDTNGDGDIDFINDIIRINNYRLKKINDLTEEEKLAGDINDNNKIDFIDDIIKINNYRLGRIKDL